MGVLLAAVAALLGAPLTDRILSGRPRLAKGVDAVLGFAIALAVFGGVLPWACGPLGLPVAIGILATGGVLGFLAHRFPALGDAVSAFAFAGLALHALVDGVALAASGTPTLGYAVVAHNVPVGMALWRAVSPTSPRLARGALLFSAFITVSGWFLAEHVASLATAAPMAALQLLAGGMLLHAAWHLLAPARGDMLDHGEHGHGDGHDHRH